MANCSSRFFGDRVHLILANPPWRQLQERAEKIPGDKKHVKGMLSQSHRIEQFNTAQERPSEQVSAKAGLLVQHHTQERSIDLKSAVVLNETHLSEFVHEKIDPWTCCADHLCQRSGMFVATQAIPMYGASIRCSVREIADGNEKPAIVL